MAIVGRQRGCEFKTLFSHGVMVSAAWWSWNAPPENEDTRPLLVGIVRPAGRVGGAPQPTSTAPDLDQGFFCIKNLGTTYLLAKASSRAVQCCRAWIVSYKEAITTLIRWQQTSRPVCCATMMNHSTYAAAAVVSSTGTWAGNLKTGGV